MNYTITFAERLSLLLQEVLSFLFYPLAASSGYTFIRCIRKITIYDHEQIRNQYRSLMAQTSQPVLICANHLNMFDSIYLHYALGSYPYYFFHFKKFAWNVAAVEVFKSTYFRSWLTYFGKTLVIDRQGGKEHHDALLAKYSFLLKRGRVCVIFPEGGRSLTGRVDPESVTYGVGRIMQETPNCRVLCIYHRASTQQERGVQPEKGDDIRLQLRMIQPQTELKGMRGARELSRSIIDELKDMEDEWFAALKDGSGH